MTPCARTLKVQVRYSQILPTGWLWRIVRDGTDEVYARAGVFGALPTEAEAKKVGEATLADINSGKPVPTEWHDV